MNNQTLTDNKRIILPILVLTKIDGKKSNKLIQGDLSTAISWNSMFALHMEKYNKINNTDEYYRDDFLDIMKKYDNYIEFLEKKQGQLEYIDSIESEDQVYS